MTLILALAMIFSPPLPGGIANGCAWLSTSELCGPYHPGIDYNLPGPLDDYGADVLASADGIVTFAGVGRWEWGNIVLIKHGDHLWTQYAHLSRMDVREGDTVKHGEVIGAVGRGAGSVYEAHLHFEIRECNLDADAWTQKMTKAMVEVCYEEPEKWSEGSFPVDWIPTEVRLPMQTPTASPMPVCTWTGDSWYCTNVMPTSTLTP